MEGKSHVTCDSSDMGETFKLHAKLKDKVRSMQVLQPGFWHHQAEGPRTGAPIVTVFISDSTQPDRACSSGVPSVNLLFVDSLILGFTAFDPHSMEPHH